MTPFCNPAAARRASLAERQTLAQVYRLLATEAPGPRPLALLRTVGLRDEVLEWLLFQDQLARAPRSSTNGDAAPTRQGLRLTDTDPVQLTRAGRAFAAWVLTQDGSCPAAVPVATPCGPVLLGRNVPHYDLVARCFTWGRHLVKCFRQPSGNQELLLQAAEAQGWPCWFADPLPACPVVVAQQRLRDTLKNLNRWQQTPCIRFRGDGTGRRLGWELC